MFLELSILTLNVWGIPFVSKDREARMQAIGKFLTESNAYDVVSLQEVWTERDYQLIRSLVEKYYGFSHYFYSGVFGSGLAILSKYPITMTLFHAWSVNGYVHRIHHGDWFGGKGVGLCKILVDKYPVNVYIAHLHAEYDRESDDYNAHRVVQAFDTAQFIQATRGDSVLQVLAGDLNTEPGDLAHRILLSASGLQDTHSEEMHGIIGTNECAYNTYTAKQVRESQPIGKRIDYILYRGGIGYRAEVDEYALPLPHNVPEQTFSFSDHEAVFSRISVRKDNNSLDGFDESVIKYSDYASTIREGIEVCESILRRLRSDKNVYFVMALLLIIPLFYIIDIYPPFGWGMFFLLAKVMFSGIVIFFIFMATMWNSIERNGILSTKLAMEMAQIAMAQRTDAVIEENLDDK